MRQLLLGAAAGLVGTVVEGVLATGQAARRGRPPVYDPSQIAGRLAQHHLDLRLDERQRRWAGHLMRWSYGPSWGVLLGVLAGRGRMRWTWPLWGLGLGGAVMAFEVIALPATGGTPPLASWNTDELCLDALNTSVYGLIVAAMLRVLRALGDAT
jgi:hypothetical protein